MAQKLQNLQIITMIERKTILSQSNSQNILRTKFENRNNKKL